MVSPLHVSCGTSESFAFTLRGSRPRSPERRAENECRKRLGECAWQIDEATCVPCMGSLGGRVRLYEARIVASGDAEHH